MHSDIMHSIYKYNQSMPRSKLTLLDGTILCLAKSFYETGNKLFMSNAELGRLLLAGEKTIQRSIDRLVDAGLLLKIVKQSGAKRRRYLIYNKKAMQEFTKTYKQKC